MIELIITFIQEHWKFIPFSAIILFLYKRNQSYKEIITNFYELLPPRNKRANVIKSWRPYIFQDLSTHKPSLSENQIDIFFNKIDTFDYKFIFFKNYYKSYTNNLNRFNNAKSVPGDPNLVMIQNIIEKSINDGIMPVDFIKIILYKLAIKGRFIKYKARFNSYMYKKTKNPKWLKF